jgi:hypothetical protein
MAAGVRVRVGVGVGVGVGVIGGGVARPPRRSRLPHHGNHHPADPVPKRSRRPTRLHRGIRSPPDRRPTFAVFELRSRADDDDDDGDDGGGGGGGSNTTDGGDQMMTPARASRLASTFWSLAYPYYHESKPGRRLFYGMILLTLVNSAVSVAFSYVSKDFWNALSSKDAAEFYAMMIKFGRSTSRSATSNSSRLATST